APVEINKKITSILKANAKKELHSAHVPVITGFIGKDKNGKITTLGRGGSDYSAAIIGAAINADEIQIWTDVSGVYSADPRIVKNARKIEKISFAECSELAYFGAKVLHPKTILPAMNKNIPVKVLNTFEPENSGTIILSEMKKSDEIVKALTCKKNITLININSTRMLFAYGFLARVFYVFDKYNISVDMISTSEVSMSLTIDKDMNLDKAVEELNQIATTNIVRNKAIVCVVGVGLKNETGIAGKIFSLMGQHKINVEMISQGASEINISFVVENDEAEKAVKLLHREFVEEYQ
ncbi:MAG: aspartate kinase, partial [Deltaproteobacteria bacterium]|nr:aspartate kinase [Deltaproteobacteria bacterium]